MTEAPWQTNPKPWLAVLWISKNRRFFGFFKHFKEAVASGYFNPLKEPAVFMKESTKNLVLGLAGSLTFIYLFIDKGDIPFSLVLYEWGKPSGGWTWQGWSLLFI